MSGPFAMVPAEVLATGNGYAIAVYAAIAQHASKNGEAYPSIARICEITGWSHPTVGKAIRVLCDVGALVKTNRAVKGMKRSNAYALPLDARTPQTANVQIEAKLPTIETTFRTDRNDVSLGWKPRFNEQEVLEQEEHPPQPPKAEPEKRSNIVRVEAPTPSEKSSKPARSRATNDAGFDRFWDAYPNHDEKKQAKSVWDRIKPDDDLVDTILAAVERQKQSDKWRRGFVKAAFRWLRDENWNDGGVKADVIQHGPPGVELLPGEVATEVAPGHWNLEVDGYKRVIRPDYHGVIFDQRTDQYDLDGFYARVREAAARRNGHTETQRMERIA